VYYEHVHEQSQQTESKTELNEYEVGDILKQLEFVNINVKIDITQKIAELVVYQIQEAVQYQTEHENKHGQIEFGDHV
jgi:hypothetical protein